MSDHQSFQRFAALAAIISFPLALGNIVLSGMALDFNMDVATNRALLRDPCPHLGPLAWY